MEITKRNGTTTLIKDEGRPFKILQLTDIHIGAGWMSIFKDKKAMANVKTIVEAADPDLIVVTGDMIYPILWQSGTVNNRREAKKFGPMMASFGKPWCYVYGNHDQEFISVWSKEQLADYYTSLNGCLFEKGEEGITGCGNYCIRVEDKDGKLLQLLMMVDSNAYDGGTYLAGFDTIHDDQIEWYKRTVLKESPEGTVAPSLAFFHIPPKEFKEGWDKCWRGDKDVTYHFGFVGEKDNYFGYPKKKEGNFFKEMVKFGSCKGMFMGHDHLSTLSITYQGIRLTYGMSIDYLAYIGIKKKHTQRGGTIIEIGDDGSFDVKPLPLDDIK